MIKSKLKIKTADGRSLRWNFHQPEKLKAAKKDREVIVFTDEARCLRGTPRIIGQQLWIVGQGSLYVMDLSVVIGWIYAPKPKNKGL